MWKIKCIPETSIVGTSVRAPNNSKESRDLLIMKDKKLNLRKIIPWVLVILWMLVIFMFSHQPATESNELSSGITIIITDIVEKVAPDNTFDQVNLNLIVRKCAHFAVYFILGILVANALISNDIARHRVVLLALLICVTYAISDEIHQLFLPGRSGQVRDVFIDSTGGLVGILLMKVIKHI